MQFAKLLTRAVACAAAAAVAAGCGGSDTKGAEGGAGGGDSAQTTAVGGTLSTNESGYVGEITPIAMRTFSGDAQEASAGRGVFLKYNCVGCHGGLAGGAMGPSLRDDEWKFGGTDSAIVNTLVQGRPAGMPAWKGVMTDQEMKQIVTYVRSMRSKQEPTWFFSPTDTTTKAMFLVEKGAD